MPDELKYTSSSLLALSPDSFITLVRLFRVFIMTVTGLVILQFMINAHNILKPVDINDEMTKSFIREVYILRILDLSATEINAHFWLLYGEPELYIFIS